MSSPTGSTPTTGKLESEDESNLSAILSMDLILQEGIKSGHGYSRSSQGSQGGKGHEGI